MHKQHPSWIIAPIAAVILGILSVIVLSPAPAPVAAQGDVIPTLTPTPPPATTAQPTADPRVQTQATATSVPDTNNDTVPTVIFIPPTNTPIPTPTPIPNARIVTEPIKRFAAIYPDLNGNGIQEEEELLGYYNVYDWNEEIVFEWEPLEHEQYFPTASYRVALYQYPLGETNAAGFSVNGREIKVSHHWANSPEGLRFVVNAFGFDEALCFGCLTQIVVLPEIYNPVINSATGTVEYFYSPAAPVGGSVEELTIVSIPFVIELLPRPGVETPEPVN